MYVRMPGLRISRRGVAAVELAVVLPLLVGLIAGVWEVGRMIQVQQILNNAARDGARLAAQGQIINLTGSFTDVYAQSSSGTPSVQATVQQYLSASGITNQTGLVVTFQFLNDDLSVNTTVTDPYQGAKNQKFSVTVTIPYSSVQWTSMGLFTGGNLTGQCIWEMMMDSPFTVNTTVPGWSP
jgi:Flp pilus assembly protein TadG